MTYERKKHMCSSSPKKYWMYSDYTLDILNENLLPILFAHNYLFFASRLCSVRHTKLHNIRYLHMYSTIRHVEKS
jgi:hypothetical protein